ncbi:MAG: hypothetical protein AAF126_01505 [Chloroflexota bacterium]
MAQPTQYDITIKVNDVDVTGDVDYRTISFEDSVNDVSYWRMTIENPTAVTPAKNHEVVVTANSLSGTPVIFSGYIMELRTSKRDNGTEVQYECDCADRKVRLQKSTVESGTLTGTFQDILSGLLSNTFPDLSSEFDFTTGVTDFAENLSFTPQGGSLLDELNAFADQTGAEWNTESVENIVNPDSDVTFDAGGYATFSIRNRTAFGDSPRAVGNPDYAAQGGGSGGVSTHSTYAVNNAGFLTVRIDFSSAITLHTLQFDYYVDDDSANDPTDFSVLVFDGSINTFNQGGGVLELVQNTATWRTVTLDLSSENFTGVTFVSVTIGFFAGDDQWTENANYDYRIDNMQFWQTSPSTDIIENLNFNNTAPATDFDFDIQNGDEFGYGFDLFEGDYDDFNAVTVIGASESIGIDWTFESDGDLITINLPTMFDSDDSSFTVSINDGSDATPSWTALTLGIFGDDNLIDDGGSAEVLYDKRDHWLLFDSTQQPPNLSKAIRVEGRITRPIRVRVDESGDEPTFAVTVKAENITSEGDAVALARAKLDKRNAVKRLEFKTYEPGLKPGQAVPIVDSARGLNETLKIQRISTRWIGTSYAEFSIVAGADDVASADVLIANNDKRSRQNQIDPSLPVRTVTFLTNNNGDFLTNNNGERLYTSS